MIVACVCGGVGEIALIAAVGTCAAGCVRKLCQRKKDKEDQKKQDAKTKQDMDGSLPGNS